MNDIAERYLELLKKSLLNELYIENEARLMYLFGQLMFADRNSLHINSVVENYLAVSSSPDLQRLKNSRLDGTSIDVITTDADGNSSVYYPARNIAFVAHSMIGRQRMNNLHDCMNRVIADEVQGDFIETGVWKGGATIFMRGFLQAHAICDRKVWVADSFEGLPLPSGEQDQGVDFSKTVFPFLAVSDAEVRELFERYGLLDNQVVFLKGWFKDTLPVAPIEKLAVLRLDGDLYSSTWDALKNLYHKLSPGGFVIIDDYYSFPGCQSAVDDYRAIIGAVEPITAIDVAGVYWRKSA